MIKRLLISVLVGFVIISCSEDFNPYGDEVNKYVLNCIIRADTSYQTVILSRSYIVDNLDPYSNTKDPNIYNAVVRIYNGDNYALLKDTLINRPASQYKTPYLIYQTKEFLPDPNLPVEVEAVLANGKAISGKTVIPNKPEFFQTENTIPTEEGTEIKFIWNVTGIVNAYLSRLGIYYYKEDESPKKIRVFYIPLDFINDNGIDYPIYPRVSSDNFLSLKMETVTKAMQLISEGDDNKGNYVILGGLFEIFSLDENLSDYYNSVSRGKDIYSVKLNESDFTEVSGAFGVVGSYSRNYWALKLTHTYIRSFDYKPGLSDVVK